MKSSLQYLHPMAMWRRFVEFAWHPSIAWQRMPQPKHRPYRWPAPGSISQKEFKYDYKTSYKESIHNVRNDKQAIHFHNTNVKMTMGRSLQDASPRIDEMGLLGKQGLAAADREQMQEIVRSGFEELKQRNEYESCVHDLQEMYYPEFLLPRSYDMCADDPVLRQLKLDLDAYIDMYSDLRVEQGKQNVMVGDPSLWQVLDNSFDPNTVRQLQSSVRDYVSNTSLQTLSANHHKIESHKVSYVHFPLENKFVE